MAFRDFGVNSADKYFVYNKIKEHYGEQLVSSEEISVVRHQNIYDVGNVMLVADCAEFSSVHRLRIGGEKGAVERIVETLDLNNIAKENK